MARLQREARRAQLLELGLQVFADTPFDAVSVEDVAQRAGISKGLLFHYFGSKRGYYVATVQAAASALLEITRLPDDEPMEGAVTRILYGFHRFLEPPEQAALFRALMRGGVGNDPEVFAIVEGARRQLVARLARRFGVAELAPGVRTRLHAWIGACEAAAIDLCEHRDLDADAFVALLVDALVGLLAGTGVLEAVPPAADGAA